jgi:hypothetical protein
VAAEVRGDALLNRPRAGVAIARAESVFELPRFSASFVSNSGTDHAENTARSWL